MNPCLSLCLEGEWAVSDIYQYIKLAIVILHNFTFNENLCKHNGIPLGEHFIYLNSVTYWPEDGLKIR